MILSSLVKDDPRGFIDLDKNLARHIGEANVAAFHEEAGNLVVDELVDNPKLFDHLMRDDAVVAELASAVQRISVKAFGHQTTSVGQDFRALSRTLMQAASGRDVSMVRQVIQGELLTNGLINDRAMRNPEVMEILNDRVQDLFKQHKAKAPKA